MKRYHLFEFGDQKWLPETYRKGLTDLLEYQAALIYPLVLPKLMRAILQSDSYEILDLCSGAGGPWQKLFPILQKRIKRPIRVTLSDKFPIKDWKTFSTHPQLKYHSEPLDALQIPNEINGFRTMFTGLHHFQKEEVKTILSQAVISQNPIAIFEFTERNSKKVKQLLRNPLASFRLSRQLFAQRKNKSIATPIVPMIHFWDGLVSHLRSYTVAELEGIISEIPSENYRWEVGEIPVKDTSANITFLIGMAK